MSAEVPYSLKPSVGPSCNVDLTSATVQMTAMHPWLGSSLFCPLIRSFSAPGYE